MSFSSLQQKRIEYFRKQLSNNNIDIALITSEANFRYLMGFKTESSIHLLIPSSHMDISPTIYTNSLEEEIVKKKNPFPSFEIDVYGKALGEKTKHALKSNKYQSVDYHEEEILIPNEIVEFLFRNEFSMHLDQIINSKFAHKSSNYDLSIPKVNLSELIENSISQSNLNIVNWEGNLVLAPFNRESIKIAEICHIHNVRTIGLEFSKLTYQDYLNINKSIKKETRINPKFQDISPIIQKQRILKDKDEIEKLKKAANISDQAFEAASELIHEAATEIQVQAKIEYIMKCAGSEKPSFDTIVVSGENSAYPHKHASDKQIQRGDLVTIDLGAIYEGYCSDMTRTVIAGNEVNSINKKILQQVNFAYNIAINQVKAGISWSIPEIHVRKYFKQQGVLENYIHSLGHGVGIEIHEAPWISYHQDQSEKIIEPGMVFTIEPGVYIPGKGGARTENTVLILEDGIEILNQTPIFEY